MRRRAHSLVAAVLSVVALLLSPAALPAQVPPAQGQEPPTEAAIDAALEAIKADSKLDEQTRTAATATYNEAKQLLHDARTWQAKSNEFEQLRSSAPGQVAQARAELAKPDEPLRLAISASDSLSRMEDELAATQVRFDAAATDVDQLEQESAARATRRVALPDLIATAGQRLDAATRDLAALPADDTGVLTSAKRIRLRAQIAEIAAEKASYEHELASYEARGNLLVARRDLATRKRARLDKLLRAYRDLVTERRKQAAATAEQEAHAAVQEAEPALVALARSNADLAARRTRLATDIASVNTEREQIQQKVQQTENAFTDIQRRIQIAGLTDAIGLQLRRHRASLPSAKQLAEKAEQRQQQIADVQLEFFDLDGRRSELSDVGARVQEVLASLGPQVGPAARTRLETRARELVETERDTLTAVRSDLERYLDDLAKLDTAEKLLASHSAEFATFIDERVLWIRSAVPIWEVAPDAVLRAGAEVLQPAAWQFELRRLGHLRVAGLLLGLLLAAVVLTVGRRRFLAELPTDDPATSRAALVSLGPTLHAALLTVLASLPLPLVVLVAGELLAALSATQAFGHELGSSLVAIAWTLLALEIIRNVCRRSGLATAHFGWPTAAADVLRRQTHWLILTSLPMSVLAEALDHGSAETWSASLGRLAFVVAAGALTCALLRVMHPRTGVLAISAHPQRPGFFHRTRALWFVVVAGTPFALIALACLGYYYSALVLWSRLITTIGLVVGIVLVNAIATRGLLVARRRLAIEQHRQRAAAREAARGAETTPEVTVPPESIADAATISEQARRALRGAVGIGIVLGAWLIWVDVLPALGILRRVDVWHDTVTRTLMVQGTDGTPQTKVVPQVIPITLADLAAALIVLLLTGLAARGLPGFLSLTLLQRAKIKAGERYAIATLTRYAILLIGVTVALAQINFGWGRLQWLLAALGLGLGFGLQEIFANFVSGLIILFERPVRVGDIVTVGDQVGKVARIRIRATTIMDWDRRELLIPNREFITTQVINWTLSDAVTRVVIPVGVGYGSDTVLARELLLKCAHQNSLVLADPPPTALFLAFADSSLSLELRVYLADRDNWPTLMDTLHTQIDAAFREAGIEIAFPQRDVHIRTVPASLPSTTAT